MSDVCLEEEQMRSIQEQKMVVTKDKFEEEESPL